MTTAPTGPTGPTGASRTRPESTTTSTGTTATPSRGSSPTRPVTTSSGHDVRSLLERVGSVTEHDDGRFVVGIGDNIETFDPGGGRDLDIDHVVMLRRFLTADGITPEGVKKG